jgi:sulfur-oxidizing protein SoxY
MTTRRDFLVLAGAAFAAPAAAQLPAGIEALRKAALQEAIRNLTGGAPLRNGRVKLDVPPLIDNGNSVPITVAVESPMTPADHVRSIHVLTEKNPQPYVLSAYFGPRAGRASLATRCRIADTGTVIAIAQTSDGAFWSDRAHVVVTLSACLEDGLI